MKKSKELKELEKEREKYLLGYNNARKELIEEIETKFNRLINKYGNYGISGDMIKQQIDDFKLKEIENGNV